jgi:chemotaxis protein MotB
MSSLFFEADKAVLKQGGTEILDYVGKALGQVEPYIKFIRIDGHTAEAAPGTSRVDNRELSTDRANEVLKYLENNYIGHPEKLMAVGYGLYRPIAPNDTEQNRAKNRRVEILIAQEDALQDELDKLYKMNSSAEISTDSE